MEIFHPPQLTHKEQRTLEALLDTLIPEDATPGALQLGVAEKLKTKSVGENQYRRLIKKGCAWLNSMAGNINSKSFTTLKEEDRDSVIMKALKSDIGSMQRIFIQQMRADAFYHYYGHPGSWTQLGYNGPPQPNGFPDYYKPPSLHS
jgi:hypothetical protein